jgi:hypothetical protein
MPGATERLARAGDAYGRRLDALDRRLEEKMGDEKIFLEGKLPRAFFAGLSDEEAARLLVRLAGAGGRPPGRKQIEKVLQRLRRDPVFHEAFAGLRLTAGARYVRLSPSKKKTTETA